MFFDLLPRTTRHRLLVCLFLLAGLPVAGSGIFSASAQTLKVGVHAGGTLASFR